MSPPGFAPGAGACEEFSASTVAAPIAWSTHVLAVSTGDPSIGPVVSGVGRGGGHPACPSSAHAITADYTETGTR